MNENVLEMLERALREDNTLLWKAARSKADRATWAEFIRRHPRKFGR